MASLLRTVSGTSSSVAAGSYVDLNIDIGSSLADIVKVEITPSVVGVTNLTVVEIFKSDAFLAADLAYATSSFSGALIDPVQNTSTERNEGYVAKYLDTDTTRELHIRITNNGVVPRTFDYEVTYISQDDAIRYAAHFLGATTGAKIVAALADLPSTGGVVDARGFTGASTITGAITLSKAGTWLILPPPSSATITASVDGAFTISASNTRITGGKLTLTGVGTSAVKFVGTIDNATIEDMVIVGSNTAADAQYGIYSGSSQTLTNVHILRNKISDVAQGISMAGNSGTLDGTLIDGNTISNAVGTSAGQGYAISCAVSTNGRIVNNYITGAQRHSIYLSLGYGNTVSNNTIYNHRTGTGVPGSPTVAIALARTNAVTASGNVLYSPKDGAISYEPDDVTPADVRGASIVGNTVYNATGVCCGFFIGSSVPSTGHTPLDVTISGNAIYSTGVAAANIMLYSGIGVNIIGNTFESLNHTGGVIYVAGYDDSGGTATYSGKINVTDNVIRATGGSARAFEIGTAACTSTISMRFVDNLLSVPGNVFLLDTTLTNPNIIVSSDALSGLTRGRVAACSTVSTTAYASSAAEGASIGSTTLLTVPTSAPGFYRLTYYIVVTRAATTSSSILLTFAWNDGVANQTKLTTAYTGNVAQAYDNQGSYDVYVDAAQAIAFTTTYASVGGTSMQYKVYVTAERL